MPESASPAAARFEMCECVEVYVPKKLEHLSEFYRYLRRKLTTAPDEEASGARISGYSVYEVDGAFRGTELFDERTLVIRILLPRTANDAEAAIRCRVETLGREVAGVVSLTEEELWICHYPLSLQILGLPASGVSAVIPSGPTS
jgi:hypothetical protein